MIVNSVTDCYHHNCYSSHYSFLNRTDIIVVESCNRYDETTALLNVVVIRFIKTDEYWPIVINAACYCHHHSCYSGHYPLKRADISVVELCNRYDERQQHFWMLLSSGLLVLMNTDWSIIINAVTYCCHHICCSGHYVFLNRSGISVVECCNRSCCVTWCRICFFPSSFVFRSKCAWSFTRGSHQEVPWTMCRYDLLLVFNVE